MFKIALVEDEKNLASLIIKYFKNEGYEIDWYIKGEDALENINKDYHLWILDIMLPGIVSGYDLIKIIRKQNADMPIIFTSARNQDIDRIMGLELGSDDYLAKPYSIRELVLRVKKIISRTYKETQTEDRSQQYIGEYLIDKERRSVFFNNELVNLTSKEFDLLIFLVENPSKALSREFILQAVWGENYFGSDRVVDDLMRRLRQKLPKLSVETIYAYGYRLLL